MKTIIILLSLVFPPPVTAFEVIFHQGFEGDQFPPPGWEGLSVYQDDDGYNSYHSAVIYRPMDRGHEGYSLESPKINILGVHYYTFRYYAKNLICGPLDEAYARLIFDVGDPFDFYSCFGGVDWEEEEATLSPPENATTVYFRFYFSPNDQTSWFDALWWIDEVSVIKTATSVEPASLGYIKAAYR
jgi:hypothetical protein